LLFRNISVVVSIARHSYRKVYALSLTKKTLAYAQMGDSLMHKATYYETRLVTSNASGAKLIDLCNRNPNGASF
jgi:hypothetical protein